MNSKPVNKYHQMILLLLPLIVAAYDSTYCNDLGYNHCINSCSCVWCTYNLSGNGSHLDSCTSVDLLCNGYPYEKTIENCDVTYILGLLVVVVVFSAVAFIICAISTTWCLIGRGQSVEFV